MYKAGLAADQWSRYNADAKDGLLTCAKLVFDIAVLNRLSNIPYKIALSENPCHPSSTSPLAMPLQ